MIFPKVDKTISCDVLIVGGGLAGTWAGIAAKEQGAKEVVLVDKAYVSRSGQSPFAAGIFTVFDPKEDDAEVWMKEMVENGDYLNDQEWIKLLFERTYPLANRMDEWAIAYGHPIFERDAEGRFIRRRSRGHIHSKHNVINSLPMMDTLRKKLTEKGAEILDNVAVTDLLVEDNRCYGALGLAYRQKKSYLFLAKTTVLAASGCGFKSVIVGHKNLTGDLQAAAFDVGVVFHSMEKSSTNTCSRHYDVHGMNLYVGVGGKFLNAKGEEFMWQYNPTLGSRARSQDLVLAFCQEVEAGRGPIYLDMSAASPSDQALCRKILPESFMLWDRAGINPFQQKVEWIPVFAGSRTEGGGVAIDLKCCTNVQGLCAAGDITWMPAHGTYAFGGINLALATVSGYIAGEEAATLAKGTKGPELTRARRSQTKEQIMDRLLPLTREKGIKPDEAIGKIQEAIIPYRYSFLRSRESLQESLGKLNEIKERVIPLLTAAHPHELVKAMEAQSMVKVAQMMMESALFREESRGVHFRRDFPRTDNVNWLKWVLLKKEGDGIKLWTEPVPTPHVKPEQDYSMPPGVKRERN